MKRVYLSITCVVYIWAILVSCQYNVKGYNPSTPLLQEQDNISFSSSIDELSPTAYVTWCQSEENKLKKQKNIGDIGYSLFYKPVDYIICSEEKTENISGNLLHEKLEELEGLEYYDFKILLNESEGELLKYNISSPAEYQQRLNYFAFDMQHDIKMIYGKDTINCALFHFERAYDVAPYAVFVLGFPKKNNPIQSATFFYQDKVFHKGIIKFTYTKDELMRIPKLKTI